MLLYRIAFIGAGKVAWHLAPALKNAGHAIVQVISRSALSAQRLADRVGCDFTDKIKDLDLEVDILFLTVPDHTLVEIIHDISNYRGLVIHTSGTFSTMRFTCQKYKYGCMYPVQTFTQKRNLDLSQVPLLIEGSEPAVTERISLLARDVSSRVFEVNTENRRNVHLAAILANNFTNHFLFQSYKILAGKNLPVSWIEPLIRETYEKAIEMGPEKAQTGPAIRNDENTINKHMELLSYNPELQEIYRLISNSIKHSVK
jgi:predicted short-subunit dehydrogenase-like oxidoreductase (DUF2520 family)